VRHHQAADRAEGLCSSADHFSWDDRIGQVPGYELHPYAKGPTRIGNRFRIIGGPIVTKPLIVGLPMRPSAVCQID
jgi:hypothetical protein